MSAKTRVAVERNFTPVQGAPDVQISPPLEGAKPGSPTDPTIILVFGWMDASLPHIQKYTESYHKLYPGATQVIVRSFQSFWLKSQETHDKEILPAVKVLKELGLFNSEDERVLVHTFSNGGCFELLTLAGLLRSQLHDGSAAAIPARAVIFDSCPGDSSIFGGVKAFTGPIRNSVLRLLASSFVLLILGLYVVFVHSMGKEDPFITLHNRLLSPETMPQKISKTFICSKADQLISYQVIEGFAERAKKEGADVQVVLYEDTPHVNHLKGSPEKYWKVVTDTWSRAVARE